MEDLVAEMDNPRLPPLESTELCRKNLKKALAEGLPTARPQGRDDAPSRMRLLKDGKGCPGTEWI